MKKFQEAKVVAQDAQKAKHYLLMQIKRLEDLEGKIDNLITIKSQKNEASSNLKEMKNDQ